MNKEKDKNDKNTSLDVSVITKRARTSDLFTVRLIVNTAETMHPVEFFVIVLF